MVFIKLTMFILKPAYINSVLLHQRIELNIRKNNEVWVGKENTVFTKTKLIALERLLKDKFLGFFLFFVFCFFKKNYC